MMKIIRTSKDRRFLKKLLNRNQLEFDEVNKKVSDILSCVRANKDKALREYTKKFDGVLLEDFLVSEDEIKLAFSNISMQLKEDLIKAKKNIEKYHKKQLKNSYFIHEEEDIILGQIIRPIEKVGIYVPGGKAAYPSTVLMNVLPAKIAGVKEIIMITPLIEKVK